MDIRVAINALNITSRPSGGRTYLLQLIAALSQAADETFHFWLLATPDVLDLVRGRIGSNVELVALPAWCGRPLPRLVVEQFYLPLWLRRQHMALLFAARNVMPLLAPCPTVIGVLSMHLNYAQDALPAWRRAYGNALLRASARRAAAFLAISEYAGRSYSAQFGLPAEKLFVAPLGYDPPDRPTEQRPARVSGDYLLFVSTLFPHKNVSLLLQVLAQLHPDFPHLKLVIVGRDVAGAIGQLTHQARQLGLADQVLLCGAVSDQELEQLYAQARVFVFPSLVEGFGLTVLEAMAHGVPVVTSHCTSLPEVVGEAGITLRPDDPSAWAEAIARLLREPAQAQALAMQARLRAAHFTWDRTAHVALDCFRYALNSPGR